MNRRQFLKLSAPGAAVLATPGLLADVPLSRTDKGFTHPGILHSREELEFIRRMIGENKEPWKTAWESLRGTRQASLQYKPKPHREVVRGPYNNPNIGSSDLTRDSIAAYAHALQWSLTGKRAHAEKAISILNVWSANLEEISGHDTLLLIGMVGVRLCCVAELIRHSDSGWKEADQQRFERLLRREFHPPIQNFFPAANGNWDASMIQTMMAMGVFLDDRAMFGRAVDYYLKGEGNGAIRNYINDFGECQESGRDQAHTQMGIGFLGCACEIAWKQGVDLYSAYDNRLALGFEYTAKYNLGHEVPYEPFRSVDGKYHYKRISAEARGHFSPIYERAVHHYHVRMGLDMPYCLQVVAKMRPERDGSGHVPWGTLTFGDLPRGLDGPGAVKPRALKTGGG